MAKRGISLLDLAAPSPGSQAIIPADLATRLENFAVVSHRSATSVGAIIHSGVIQPMSDLGFPSLRNWDVEVPGLNAGLPFRLVRTRTVQEAGQTLEPAGSSAFLDLVVDRIAITAPGLRPATVVPSAPASVGHLLPDTSRSKVRIVGSGVVRLDLSGNGDLVRFVDWPDPFDPSAPSGAVVRLTFDPVSFFIGGSEIGMTVDRLVFDASVQVTPPEIIARGQTPGWQGIAIAEATLYLPPNTPAVDKVKVAVRDVLLGSPAGLQGEIQVELGRTPINAAAVQFLQDFAAAEQPRPTQGSGRELTVPFLTGTPSTARMRAKFDPAILSTSTQPRMQWRLPAGTVIDGNDTGWFGSSVGEVMSGRFSERVDGTEVFDTPTTYTFVQSEPEVQHAAKVSVHVGAVDIANVVSVSGSPAALNLLEFESALNPADAAGLKWKHGDGGDAHTRTGPDFVLMPASEPGTSYIVVTDANHRARRIRVDVLAEGSLLIGAEDGVHDATGALLDVRGVEETYNLNAFHRDGSLKPFTANNAPVSGGVVTVPDGGLAEVTLGIGSGADPEAPAPAVTESEVRHLRIRFEYGLSNPVTFDRFAPRTQQGTLEATVRAWAAFFPDATFVVIGRCCDLSSASYNAGLATNRAEAVAAWLPAGSTHARGEQTSPSPAMVAAQNAVVPTLEPAEKAAIRLVIEAVPSETRASWGSVATQPDRQAFRRVDIYAVGGTFTPPAGADPSDQQQPTDTQELDPALRRSYVPGEDADEVQPPDPSGPRLPWLVRLVVRWDSPTVTEWADAIPTQAEFTFEWAASPPRTIPAPGGGEHPLPVRSPSQPAGTTSTEVYTLTGRWSYDSRSGQTVFSLSIASSGDPEGLGAIDSEFLAVALALAPALLAGIGAAGVDGAAVRIAALAVASGVLATVAKDGEVVLNAAEIEHRQRSLTDVTGFRTRVLLDYTAAIGLELDANALGRFGTGDGHPLKVRYKKVGLEFDDSQTEWYDKFGLVFDDVSFEVCEPGRWQIDGPLGQVLQVVATRAGVGSSWFECDLEFALDLGVVSINGATVRCTFTDSGFSAELRGLALGVNIPNVLRGEGRVVLGDGGAFKAALEVELESVGAKGMGALAFDPSTDFLSIALGLVLPVGIPLANTGLGVFGFIGMFVSNGARALPTGHAADPVGREIAWYRDTAYEDKFAPQRGQWALGLGMIVGTLPDQAFTFNAMGMFVVAFPDPTVIFGIDAKLVKKPAARPATQGPPADPSLSILGLIAIDDEAVTVGVRGRYTIPKVLELLLPIDGYFPYASTSSRDAYVRIGSDGVLSVDPPRPGDPVTITLLPDTLDVTAFSYLMIEERQLHRLGDNPDFNFDGFAVGFGAGWEIRWSAGPIRLEASAKVLVGFGTNPFLLKGGIFVRGELSLVVVKVSARGSIVVTVWEDGGVKVNLDGEFCGSVSFFFFSIEGCVGIEIGDPITPTAPPPPPPIGKVSLTDRRGFTTAVATTGTPGLEETVWPDTVPVIEFTHHLAVDLTGSAFNPGGGPAGPAWAGTSELKYAYRLTGVEIVPDSGAALAGPLDSGWWLPTNRPGVLADGDVAVSESEGMFLALLAWDPAPWSYWLTDGGAGTAGDPATTPGRLCDPPTRPRPGCVLGERGTRSGVDAVDFRPDSLGTPPFPSRFTMYARERAFGMPVAGVTPFLSASGWGLTPGQTGPSPFGDNVWWLAALTDHSFTARTTELRGVFAPEIGAGELLLVVCRDLRKRPSSTQLGACEVVADHFEPDRDIGTGDAIGSVKIVSHSASMRTFEGVNGAGTSLHYPDDGMTFFLPGATDRVVVTVQPQASSVEARALDARGEVVAETGTGPEENPVDLVLAGPGIVQVELHGGAFEVGVLQVCWGSTLLFPRDAEDAVIGDLPVVLGTVAGGGEQEWTPEVERQARTLTGTCSLVRYTAPDRATTWSGLRIREWAGTGRQDAGRIGLVQVCGVSAQADTVATANADYIAFLLGLINGLATTAEPARKNLLEPNRGYSINVAWEWQGWIKTDAQPLPPATPPVSGWQAGTPQSYRFRTAAAATTGGVAPAELTDERDFDPRSMLRYLIAFDPDKGSTPHLLDDTLLVHLAVDHLDQLAGLYGRHVQLRLRRTDPPPGSLATQPHPDDEPITVAWGKLHDRYRPAGHKRFLDAIRDAPCVEEPNLGGTTGEVTADLVPGAWYDLMLMATPTGSPNAEDVVVSRSHFQASRYRNETELLEALGFGVPGPEAFIAPDAIVSAAVPAGSLAVGDADLDAALVAAGLDPWPLSDRARTSILWLNDAETWRMAGLLLEAPEAIVRTGRTALDVTACTYGGVSLSQRARNLAGTRVLLTPPSPVVVAAADRLTITLTRTDTDRTGTTTSTTISGARFALGEPRSVLMEAGV